MNRRYAKLVRRGMLLMATLPLFQAVGCGSETIARIIATGTATEAASFLGTSLETILLNAFGA